MEKQLKDITKASYIFPAKSLPEYHKISYVAALKLARTENFGVRNGKKLFIIRDKFITWLDQKSEELDKNIK